MEKSETGAKHGSGGALAVVVVVFLFGGGDLVLGEEYPPDGHRAIQQLLEWTAPFRDWKDYLSRTQKPRVAPALSASDDDLIEYWTWVSPTTIPDTTTGIRLLEVCERQPHEFPSLSSFLPSDEPQACNRIKKLCDRVALQKGEPEQAIAQEIHDWLVLNSDYFREELVDWACNQPNAVSKEKQNKALERLVRLDRKTAEDRLTKASKAGDADRRALALAGLLEYSVADSTQANRTEWLEKLKKIAADSQAAKSARSTAISAMMTASWDGKDDWFLSLLRDDGLSKRENNGEELPLEAGVIHEPDKWVSLLTNALTNHGDAVRANAAQCLSYLGKEKNRDDAIKPLLPWIADRNWVAYGDDWARWRVFDALGHGDFKGAIPYLRKAAEKETGNELVAVAEALARYNVQDTVPILRKSLSREKAWSYRRDITSAIRELGGFSPKEIATGMRDYALRVSELPEEEWTHQGWEKISKTPHSFLLDVGFEASEAEIKDEAITRAILDEIRRLGSTKWRAAEILWNAIAKSATPSSHAATITRLKSGKFTAQWLVSLIETPGLPESLKQAKGLEGIAAGVRAALSRDRSLIEEALTSDSADMKLALLACARSARVDLPMPAVLELLDGPKKDLAAAADRYLEAHDTPEARNELRKRAGEKPRIFGEQLNFAAAPMNQGAIWRTQTHLLDLFRRSQPPREIYALLSEGNFGNNGQRVIFVYDNRVTLRSDDGFGRVRERELSNAEFEGVHDWIVKNRVAELPLYDEGAMDGIQLQYVHLTPKGGERVFMNNPPGGPMGRAMVMPGIAKPRPDPIVYSELVRRMTKLNRGEMKVAYPTLAKLPGYRIVHVKEQGEVVRLKSDDGHLLAGVLASEEKSTIEWHKTNASGLAKEPWAVTTPNRTGDDVIHEQVTWERSIDIQEGPFAGNYFRTWKSDTEKDEGLRVSDPQGKSKLIATGNFGPPVICAGGEWIIVAKTSGHALWNVPNGVVRIDLRTKQIIPVDLPPADNFDPIAWIPGHRRVLLWRSRDKEDGKAGPTQAEFYLLDPFTGKHERVFGEFGPCFDFSRRALQPSTRPNEFWAVIYEERNNESILGRYDAKDFRFTSILKFPDVSFHSENTWIDESSNTIWVILNGDLLRFDLPAEK